MQFRLFTLAAAMLLVTAAGANATSDLSAKHKYGRHHHHARTHVTVYRNAYGWENGYGSGPDGYPSHRVPEAAYPSPGGIGLSWAPMGYAWDQRWSDRRDGGWR